MDTTALVSAASDTGTSGWFEGWIGGLIAAAVTISATIWWEARSHRRQQLDDAVVGLSDACNAMADALLDMSVADRTKSRFALHMNAVAISQMRVGALSHRRTVGVPAWLCAPTRSGLGRTLGSLDDTWISAMRGLPSTDLWESMSLTDWVDAVDSAGDECRLQSRTCLAWLNNPWQFAWNRDISVGARETGLASPASASIAPRRWRRRKGV